MKSIAGSWLCQDMEDAQKVLNRLSDPATKTVVYDVETDGLDWRTNMIVGHVVTFGPRPDDTYYVPVRHTMKEDGGNVHPHLGRFGHPFEVALNKISSTRRDILWIGHNIQFDLMALFGHGVHVLGDVEDTQVNAALLNENIRKYSLAECCARTGAVAKKGDELYCYMASVLGGKADRNQMGQYWKLRGDDPMAVEYAVGDGVSTWSLRKNQLEYLAVENLTSIHKLESDVSRVMYRMAKRGVKVNLGRLDEVLSTISGKVAEALSALPEDFNSRSPKSMKALMESHGHTNWPMTAPTKRFPQGQPQFNEAFLKTNAIGNQVLNLRKFENLANSFALPLRDRHVFEGRVRPRYYQMSSDDFGTSTGRFSCSEPNLQQSPKRNKELSVLIRSVFEADEGMTWWDADYSQCEPRLLAHYGRVKTLLNGYLSIPSVDAHSAVADSAGIPRQAGKTLNQTLITGGGRGHVLDLLSQFQSPNATPEQIYDKYFEALPEIKDLQAVAKNRFRMRGYLISLLGRKSRLEDPSHSYKGVNRLLQCGNADVVKKAMVRIDNHFESTGDVCHMLNTVHDSLSFQAHPEHDDIMMEALRLMADFGPGRNVDLAVPLEIEYGKGKTWAEATFADQTVFGGMDYQHLYEPCT